MRHNDPTALVHYPKQINRSIRRGSNIIFERQTFSHWWYFWSQQTLAHHCRLLTSRWVRKAAKEGMRGMREVKLEWHGQVGLRKKSHDLHDRWGQQRVTLVPLFLTTNQKRLQHLPSYEPSNLSVQYCFISRPFPSNSELEEQMCAIRK